jgi:hypothetical protein
VIVALEDGYSDIAPNQLAALAQFLALPPDGRNQLTHRLAVHCYETVLETRDEAKPARVALGRRSEVWDHVSFQSVIIPEHAHSKDRYVFVWGESDWDPEGLELLFKNGELFRVTPQEGLPESEEWVEWFLDE